MKRLFSLFNLIGLFGGGAGAFFMLVYVNPVAAEGARISIILGFLALLLWSVWSLLALLGFGFRRLFTDTPVRTAKITAQRQGFLLAFLLCLNLFLRGMLVWNTFSSIILVLTVIMAEYYFLQRQHT